MCDRDRRTIERFDKLAVKLVLLEHKRTCTYDELMCSTRIMERMAAIRDSSSPAVRKELRKRGWQS